MVNLVINVAFSKMSASEIQVNQCDPSLVREPKICSNCNLQTGEFWVYECLWEYNNTSRVCKPCVAVYMCSVCAFFVN